MSDPVRGRRRRYILVLMALTALTLATLSERNGDTGPIGTAGRAAHRVVQPITDAADSVFGPIHDWWHGFWHHGAVVSENRKLRQELDKALAQIDDNNTAIERLKSLDTYFHQTYWRDYKSTGATVVADSPGNNETTVQINVGREAGIRDGMAVVGQRGLIGTVLESWTGGSKVLLISDPAFGVAARTLVGDKYTTASTDADGALRLTFTGNGQPKHIQPKIKVGDWIVTCGCNKSRVPAGIPIGQVSNVSVSFDGSLVHVAVVPTLDRTSLDQVRVLLWTPGQPFPKAVTQKLAQKPATTTTSTTTIPGASTTTTTTGG